MLQSLYFYQPSRLSAPETLLSLRIRLFVAQTINFSFSPEFSLRVAPLGILPHLPGTHDIRLPIISATIRSTSVILHNLLCNFGQRGFATLVDYIRNRRRQLSWHVGTPLPLVGGLELIFRLFGIQCGKSSSERALFPPTRDLNANEERTC